jgi:hypothetical protein
MFKINADNTFGSTIFPRTVTSVALTNANPTNYLNVPSKTISVATGDKVVYRIDANGNVTSASSVLATNIYVDPNEDLKQYTYLQAHLGNNLTAASFVAGNANVVNDTLRTGNWNFYVAGNTSIAAITGASGSSGEWTVGNLLSYSVPAVPPNDMSFYFPFNVADINPGNETQFGEYSTGSYVYSGNLFDDATITVGSGSRIADEGYLKLDAAYSQYATIPSFATGTNGLTFACWFRTNSDGAARIFEFSQN